MSPIGSELLVSDEGADALTPEARDVLGDQVLKFDLYDLEQQIQNDVADRWWTKVLSREMGVADLLADHVVRDLHRSLYAPVWRWGGRQRSRETNIGIAPGAIAVQMRTVLDDLSYQWSQRSVVDPRALGVATHAALVHIHPFADGNGRVTRLLADLVYLAAQEGGQPLLTYAWEIDQREYVRLLRQYDKTRDPSALTQFIPVASLEELPNG